MSSPANYADGGPGLILLAVHANLPVRGRVQGKVPDVASVSTGYRITVQLSAVAEVAARHTGNDVTFDPPEIRDLHVSISRLEFSNDLLEAGHRQVRRIVNHELAHNEERIREAQTNRCKRRCPTRGADPAPGIFARAVDSFEFITRLGPSLPVKPRQRGERYAR